MILILTIPLITAFLCIIVRNETLSGYLSLLGSIVVAAVAAPVIVSSISTPVEAMNGMLYMDAFSAYMMGLILFLSITSAAFSISYLRHEKDADLISSAGVRRYYMLLHLFVFSMVLVTVSNNLAVMWIAIEATTIISAPLIGMGYRKRPIAIEAAWKYIILCTVGITFALLGVFITYYASTAVIGTEGALDWTVLQQIADSLNPATMRLAFIFILVGYGTKAGFVPLHNWLPDAHSQAPSPISALLSGILLNTAFYGILRFVAIVSPSTGTAFTGNLLLIFGLLSFGLAAIFIVVQDNYKRLLAYSSIEHMGIMTIGAGIGSVAGLYGSLLHILNHAVAKPLLFYTSGKIQGKYGSTNIEDVNGVLSKMPLLGTMTFIGVLALAGSPPFNVFVSEFAILKAAVDKDMWIVTGLFLFFAAVVFYGILSGFGKMLLGKEIESGERVPVSFNVSGFLGNLVMITLTVLIIALGFKVPCFIDTIIRNCISILGVK